MFYNEEKIMEEQSTIILRERWLPFVQVFFSTHQSRVTEAQIEQFTVEVFTYISQTPCWILQSYYKFCITITKIRSLLMNFAVSRPARYGYN